MKTPWTDCDTVSVCATTSKCWGSGATGSRSRGWGLGARHQFPAPRPQSPALRLHFPQVRRRDAPFALFGGGAVDDGAVQGVGAGIAADAAVAGDRKSPRLNSRH